MAAHYHIDGSRIGQNKMQSRIIKSQFNAAGTVYASSVKFRLGLSENKETQ